MPDYMEYLNLPTAVIVAFAGLLFVTQAVGKILELKGKVAPEFMTLAKFFRRKRKERRETREALALMPEVKRTLEEFNAHYSADNITKRNDWMRGVDSRQEQDHEWIERLGEKLDNIKAELLSIRIEDMRSAIIGFAQYVVDEKAPATREQFNRIFKMHEKYETILEDNGLTNGEVTAAMRIINESYAAHMRNHTFVEDTRWGAKV